jgi:hypothetical protein
VKCPSESITGCLRRARMSWVLSFSDMAPILGWLDLRANGPDVEGTF